MGRRKNIPELTKEFQNSFCKIDSSDSFIWGKVLTEGVIQKHWVLCGGKNSNNRESRTISHSVILEGVVHDVISKRVPQRVQSHVPCGRLQDTLLSGQAGMCERNKGCRMPSTVMT